MSGLVKAKKYDWKDSNMALFGSDTEKQVKKESAESEPAWHGSGQEVGLQIWRIVKFKVEPWPKEDYGKFFDGDSYIILNTYKTRDSDELLYDVHFWIGKNSTQDEYCTAAYKTVELDTYHDDKPVQHREVQGHESAIFKSYFNTIQYLKGGADTGFRSVKPEEYKPRLLKFKKEGKNVTMSQVPRSKSQLDEGDVFILDMGLTIYQWNGAKCNYNEKFRAAQELQTIKSERGGRPSVTVLEAETNEEFESALDEEDDDEEADVDGDGDPVLNRISDADGSIDMEQVKEGKVLYSDLSPDDVFLIDIRKALYVWIGRRASPKEIKNAMSYGHSYLQNTSYAFIPITVVKQGKENKEFKTCIPGCA